MSIIRLFLTQTKAILYRNYRIYSRSWKQWIGWILILPTFLLILLPKLFPMKNHRFNGNFPMNLIDDSNLDNGFLITFSYPIHESLPSCFPFEASHPHLYTMNVSVFVDIINRNRYILIHSIENFHSSSLYQQQMKGKICFFFLTRLSIFLKIHYHYYV